MNLWIIILLAAAELVLDYLIRRKKWKDNSRAEKISLLLNMLSVGPYAFLSMLGLLLGIASGSPETAFGELLYNVTCVMAGFYFIVAFAAVILSLILRKKGKTKASIRTNIIALLYIIVVFAVNFLAVELL